MATFTVTTDTNIDALAGKAGGDIYNVNGAKLTIDQDSRYGANQNTSASLANTTISSTLGGEVHIDGTNVRLIPYNTGSGNVPALNTLVTQGGVTGKLIGVWDTLTTAPIAVGAAMPADGFIKIKQKAGGNFAAGALTNIGATATGPDIAGWLEIVGDDAATMTVPRLGTFRVTGEWYELGNTSGAANQQLQLPTSGSLLYCPGIYIEKVAGGGDFEFYANAGSQTAVATDIRAKVCWITTAGLVRIGHNGTANAGYVPPSGRRIVVPNVFFTNCTTAARTANVLPNATLATRYDFTTTGGGVILIDKAAMTWYPSLAQAFQINLSNFAYSESMSITECASPIVLDTVGCGQIGSQTQTALVLGLNFAGTTLTDCHFSRYSLTSAAQYNTSITNCSDVVATNCRFSSLALKGNATTGNITIIRSQVDFTGTDLINGRILLTTVNNSSFTDTSYVDVITGTTATTAAQNSFVFEMSAVSTNIVIDGIDFMGLTNVQPYLGVVSIIAAGCSNVKVRNIGTRATPLSFGSVNLCPFLISLGTGAAASNVKVQRCYVSNTRTNFWTSDNSSSNILIENCAGDYADAPVTPTLNTLMRAVGVTHPLTAQTACYGSHFIDMFTSTTAGRIGILMNEPTADTAAQVTLANGAKFTSAGGLYMPTIGMEAIFEMPYFAKGITAFPNSLIVLAGGTITNYTLEYQIDKNDGSGYNGVWKVLSGTNLSAETGLSASLGVKLKVRITTSTTNTSAFTSLYIPTTTTAVAQDNLYPLDTFTLSVSGIQTGSDVVVYQAGTETVLSSVDSYVGTSWPYVYETPTTVDIAVFKAGYVPYFIRSLLLSSADAAVPVAQVVDRAYLL